MKLIERKKYLSKLISVIGTPDIKVITGIRRSGKSKLLSSFSSYIKREKDNVNIVEINLNLRANKKLLEGEDLYSFVSESYVEGRENFLIIDEIQLCEGFEEIINSIYEENRYDIYLTGSNAFLLSSDLATLFGGRVFEISVYPFSFSEYLDYYSPTDLQLAFDDYVKQGGLSGSYLYKDADNAKQYLQAIVRTTVIKDIIKKYKIENENLLNMIVDYLMDNVGNQTSIRKVANTLTSKTYKTNDKTCGAYIGYLCKSFLFYSVTRYDIKGKRYLENDKKYYLVDSGLRYAILGTKNLDWGHVYENIVAIELLRRGYELYVGNLYNKEIDFVAMKNGYQIYIQVSDDISSESTLTREISPLLSIRDAYPKVLLARTKHEESHVEGVRIIDLATWLSQPEYRF